MTTFTPFHDAAPLLGDPVALRERMSADGFLYLPGLLPRAAALDVAGAVLAICRDHGWSVGSGRAARPAVIEGADGWFDVYDPLQRLEPFHALPHEPAAIRAVRAIVEEAVLVHPRNIARIVFPGAEQHSTPPHQDFVHIQGAHDTYTLWSPLVDCPVELGPLAVLAGSHRLPVLPVHPSLGAGGVAVQVADLPGEWHAQGMLAGDALLFHSHTIHRALPNTTADRMRISLDARYQGVSRPIVADSLEPHFGRMSWTEIYAGWSRRDLQWYWRGLPLTIAERQPLNPAPAAMV